MAMAERQLATRFARALSAPPPNRHRLSCETANYKRKTHISGARRHDACRLGVVHRSGATDRLGRSRRSRRFRTGVTVVRAMWWRYGDVTTGRRERLPSVSGVDRVHRRPIAGNVFTCSHATKRLLRRLHCVQLEYSNTMEPISKAVNHTQDILQVVSQHRVAFRVQAHSWLCLCWWCACASDELRTVPRNLSLCHGSEALTRAVQSRSLPNLGKPGDRR